MKFKAGDTIKVIHRPNSFFVPRGIYTFDRYNSYDKTLCYTKEHKFYPVRIANIIKLTHYNTKLGKILYK